MRIAIDSETGCWNWTGSRDANGYGKVAHQLLVSEPAHRASYRLFVGRLLPGWDIDHLCRNPSCVNPEHLELVTHRENVLRGAGPSARNYQKPECVKGHEFDELNTYISPAGARQCRKCRAAAERKGQKARRERARQAALLE